MNRKLTNIPAAGTSRGFDPERQTAIIWSVDDIQEIRKDLSEEQAMKILIEAERKHDASYGISWDTLDCMADLMFPIESHAPLA